MKLKIVDPEKFKLWKYWVETITGEALDRLTAWEFDFITSMEQLINDEIGLTDKQAETLERIYAKYTR